MHLALGAFQTVAGGRPDLQWTQFPTCSEIFFLFLHVSEDILVHLEPLIGVFPEFSVHDSVFFGGCEKWIPRVNSKDCELTADML